MNRMRIGATLVGKSETRYTPAGLAVQESTFRFAGAVVEANAERTLDFEFEGVAVGEIANRLNKVALGVTLQLDGFIAPRSKRSRRLRVHITEYSLESGS
ncbi:MAG TPA: primosomal replication protein N [Burkholderiaceae bacterium]|nr:primosomal replication protein N [Burkholderiaceae bacterium]